MSPHAQDPAAPLPPSLARLEAETEALDEDARQLCAGLGAEQLVWRSAPGRWSIADCLGHLNTLGFKVLPMLRDAVAAGWTEDVYARKPWKATWKGRLLARSMEPPYRVRMKAPRAFVPPPPPDPHAVVREFVELQGELAKLLREANGLDFARIKVVSPVARWMKMQLGDYLAFLLAHERRHVWQAWQVREHPAFPPSSGA